MVRNLHYIDMVRHLHYIGHGLQTSILHWHRGQKSTLHWMGVIKVKAAATKYRQMVFALHQENTFSKTSRSPRINKEKWFSLTIKAYVSCKMFFKLEQEMFS